MLTLFFKTYTLKSKICFCWWQPVLQKSLYKLFSTNYCPCALVTWRLWILLVLNMEWKEETLHLPWSMSKDCPSSLSDGRRGRDSSGPKTSQGAPLVSTLPVANNENNIRLLTPESELKGTQAWEFFFDFEICTFS